HRLGVRRRLAGRTPPWVSVARRLPARPAGHLEPAEANFSTGVDPDGFAVTSPRYVRKDFQDQSTDCASCGNLAVLSLNSFLQFYSIERLDTPVATIHFGSSESSFAKETVCVRAFARAALPSTPAAWTTRTGLARTASSPRTG
uniref:Pept_C1 domain-containing protein n=1 Tax=Macrostomum lignano TaxID=282301 RepID=A0A1I8F465_9PLAT